MTNEPSEAQRFDAGVRKILSVSHDELKRREEQWKRERAAKKAKAADRSGAKAVRSAGSAASRP